MLFPFILFWVLMFFCRQELELKGIVISIAIWIGLLLGCLSITDGNASYYFTAGQVIVDIILILKIFGSDINIR